MRTFIADYRDPTIYQGCTHLLIDPPWNYDKRTKKAVEQVSKVYSVWEDNQKEVRRIFDMCHAAEVEHVFMWITNSIEVEAMKAALAVDGYLLLQTFTWVKTKSRGGLSYGLGNSGRNATEHLKYFRLKKKNGKSIKPLELQCSNVVVEFSGKRTRKPKEFEAMLVRSCLGSWRYVFSGYESEPFKGLNIDLMDLCYADHIEESDPGLLGSRTTGSRLDQSSSRRRSDRRARRIIHRRWLPVQDDSTA